mmetsp:Transcript_19789/g.31589  ORF Transcript_19789/g.31589 Transcript_19789/m.31589 type:complete len:240 (+) Transcript_19789:79-798(+)
MGPLPRYSPNHSFGVRSVLPEQLENHTPGPGQYGGQSDPSHLYRKSGTAIFGTSGRDERSKTGPGPGAYGMRDIGRGMAEHGPKYTLALKTPRQQNLPTDGPGPGAYGGGSPPFAAGAPSYSMASPRIKRVDEGHPGPANYVSGNKEILFLRSTKPGFGFGSSDRMSPRKMGTPGPGQYSTRSTLGGPKHSLATKTPTDWDKCITDGPGPGNTEGISSFSMPTFGPRHPNDYRRYAGHR